MFKIFWLSSSPSLLPRKNNFHAIMTFSFILCFYSHHTKNSRPLCLDSAKNSQFIHLPASSMVVMEFFRVSQVMIPSFTLALISMFFLFHDGKSNGYSFILFYRKSLWDCERVFIVY